MAATLEQLEARMDALKQARDSGVLNVRHGDTSVTYRSQGEIEKAISALQAEINKLNGVVRKPRYVREDSRGF